MYFTVLAVFGLLVLFAAFIASQGVVDTFGSGDSRSVRASRAPGWAAPCLKTKPRTDRELVHRCARVEGRVLWTKSRSDKVHLLVVSRFKLYLAKFAPPPDRTPGMGSTVVVTGPMVKSRNGIGEIQVVKAARR